MIKAVDGNLAKRNIRLIKVDHTRYMGEQSDRYKLPEKIPLFFPKANLTTHKTGGYRKTFSKSVCKATV